MPITITVTGLDKVRMQLADIIRELDIPTACMDGAKVLRDASYNNYLGIDPDAPDDEFTTTLVEDGGEFKAEEENFSLADMEFGTGEPGVVAFPFVRPAMDANLTAMDKAIAENIQNQIKASIG